MGEAVRKSAQLLTLEKAMRDLPPLPTVTAKILVLTGDANSRSEDLERYISTDQAISTKVLRVVNSPYFGVSGQVSSLGQAILVLGFDQVRNLVLSMSASKLFESNKPEVKAIHLYFWRHSFATAAAAQVIAKRKRLEPRDLDFVFSGGLLSNIGALFLASQYSKPYQAIFKKHTEDGADLSDFEFKTFGTDHASLGQELGVLWKFPENLVILIGRHEGEFSGDPIPTAYCVHAGDRIAQLVCADPEHRPDSVQLDAAVDEWLGFTEEDYRKIIAETEAKLADAADMLGLFGG